MPLVAIALVDVIHCGAREVVGRVGEILGISFAGNPAFGDALFRGFVGTRQAGSPSDSAARRQNVSV